MGYEIPVPPVPGMSGNMADSRENHGRFGAGIEQSTGLEDQLVRPLDEVVDDDVDPISTSSNPAMAAANAAWHAKSNGKVNGNMKGKSSGHENGTASKLVKPTLNTQHNSANGNSSGESRENGKSKSPTTTIITTNNPSTIQSSAAPIAAAEKAIKYASGDSGGWSGRTSQVQTKHTDSGFAEIQGDETPVSPRTVVPPYYQTIGGRRA